jgi:hypothetical protein
MWVPFPNRPIEVPAEPDEDCRGRIVIGVAVALLVEAAILVCALAIYEVLGVWMS